MSDKLENLLFDNAKYGKMVDSRYYVYDAYKYLAGIIIIDEVQGTVGCSNFIYNTYEDSTYGASSYMNLVNSFIAKLDSYLKSESDINIRHSYIDNMKAH